MERFGIYSPLHFLKLKPPYQISAGSLWGFRPRIPISDHYAFANDPAFATPNPVLAVDGTMEDREMGLIGGRKDWQVGLSGRNIAVRGSNDQPSAQLAVVHITLPVLALYRVPVRPQVHPPTEEAIAEHRLHLTELRPQLARCMLGGPDSRLLGISAAALFDWF